MIDYLKDMTTLALRGDAQGILFWAAIYTVVLLTYSLVYQIRICRWPSVEGELVDSGVKKFGPTDWIISRQEYMADALYIYTVDGHDYHGKRISPWVTVATHNLRFILQRQLNTIEQPAAGKVVVYYNPKKPKKSFLKKPGIIGQAVTAVLAITPLALYWSKYIA